MGSEIHQEFEYKGTTYRVVLGNDGNIIRFVELEINKLMHYASLLGFIVVFVLFYTKKIFKQSFTYDFTKWTSIQLIAVVVSIVLFFMSSKEAQISVPKLRELMADKEFVDKLNALQPQLDALKKK